MTAPIVESGFERYVSRMRETVAIAIGLIGLASPAMAIEDCWFYSEDGKTSISINDEDFIMDAKGPNGAEECALETKGEKMYAKCSFGEGEAFYGRSQPNGPSDILSFAGAIWYNRCHTVT